MSDNPRRWLDEGASPSVRALLESAELDEPTEAQLASLAVKVAFLFPPIPPGGGGGGGAGGGGGGAPPVPGGGAAAGAGGAAAVGGASKLVAVVSSVILGAVAGTTAMMKKEPVKEPAPVVVAAPAVVVDAGLAAMSAEPEPVPEVKPAAPVKVVAPPVKAVAKVAVPAVVAPAPAPPPPASQGDAELSLLQQAMTAAQSGEPAAALAAVAEHARRFPDSPMAQEREVIAVEALAALGRHDEAKARVAAFRAHWPTSTHLLRLERLIAQ